MQELHEKHQDKYKKIFSKEKIEYHNFVQENFSKKNLLPRVLLSSNRLPVANILFKLIYKAVINYHEHVIDYQCFEH